MNGRNTKQAIEGGRYDVAMTKTKPITFFVVDRTRVLPPRRMGPGARGLREAIWLARLLNGSDKA
ncbi:MAG: hypothetical protein SangKO_067630 [Sandaracinaceae bacterium]